MNVGQGDQVVVFGIPGQWNDLAGVGNQIRDGRGGLDVQLGDRKINPATHPWALRKSFLNFAQSCGAYHYFEVATFQPRLDDAMWRTGPNGSRNESIGFDDNLHPDGLKRSCDDGGWRALLPPKARLHRPRRVLRSLRQHRQSPPGRSA